MIVAVAVAVFVVWAPRVLSGLASLRRRGGRSETFDVRSEGRFVQALLAEVRRGASLRAAIEVVAEDDQLLAGSSVARRSTIGLPIRSIADDLGRHLPFSGTLLSAAISFAAITGAPMTNLLGDISGQCDRRAAVCDEQRALGVQVKLSAVVVGGVPVLVTVLLVASGGVSRIWQSEPGRILFGTGIILQLVGLTSILMLLRRAVRH